MTKKKFNRSKEWPFSPVSAKRGKYAMWDRADNDDIFLTWLIHKLRRLGGRAPEDGERMNAQALSLSKSNNTVLMDYISPGLYLAFSPRDDDALTDAEIGVDMDAIYVKGGK
jgi:hypothetical protein